MGWQVSPRAYQGAPLMEAMGCLQSIRLAEQELKTALSQIPEGERPSRVKVKVFSDCQGVLKPLQDGRYAKKQTKANMLLRRPLRKITEASHRLRDTDFGLPVDLSLHWLKGHSGRVQAHTLADKAAYKAACNGTFATIRNRRTQAFPCALDQALMDELEQVHSGSTKQIENRSRLPRENKFPALAKSVLTAAPSLDGTFPVHPGPGARPHAKPKVFGGSMPEGYSDAFAVARGVFVRAKASGFVFSHHHHNVYIVDEAGKVFGASICTIKQVNLAEAGTGSQQ